MNCVYDAFVDYMKYTKQRMLPDSIKCVRYLLLIRLIQGYEPQSTFGGVVPWIYKWLIVRKYLFNIQHTLFTWDHWMNAAENDWQRLIVSETDFGEYVDQITLKPAVYLMLDSQHAVFSETVPSGIPIMAIQLSTGGSK